MEAREKGYLNIIVDVGHPAHVHLFRNSIQVLSRRGHRVLIVARDKDVTIDLLKSYGFAYRVISSSGEGTLRQLRDLLERDFRLLQAAKSFQPDIMVGTSISVTHISRMVGAKAIFFTEDDFAVARASAVLSYPFAHTICVPDCISDRFFKGRYVKHSSYHELAYLHPNRFSPDPSVLTDLGIGVGERFFILRFVALKAVHDIGESGLSLDMRRQLVRELSRLGRVFITTEGELSEEFRLYQIRISPEKMHDALYYATMFISDSQTMTAEAAVLGIPAIRCNTFVGRISYLEELEHRYDLTYGFLPKDEDRMFDRIMELLHRDDLRAEWQRKRKRMLAKKIDLTAWIVNFVERYPQSFYEYRERIDDGGVR